MAVLVDSNTGSSARASPAPGNLHSEQAIAYGTKMVGALPR